MGEAMNPQDKERSVIEALRIELADRIDNSDAYPEPFRARIVGPRWGVRVKSVSGGRVTRPVSRGSWHSP